MEVMLALFIVLGATIVILNLGRFAERAPFSVSGLEYINTQLKYQFARAMAMSSPISLQSISSVTAGFGAPQSNGQHLSRADHCRIAGVSPSRNLWRGFFYGVD